MDSIARFLSENWTAGIEILLLACGIYGTYLFFRGTGGARVFVGLMILFMGLTMVSQILNLTVISWLLRSLTTFVAIALVIIFQPEARRMLARLGSLRLFASTTQKKETITVITEAVFELSSRQIGALIAIERNTGNRRVRASFARESFAKSAVDLDSKISKELLLTIFSPTTSLHDGGVIVRGDRLLAAACTFPVSQRENLDHTFGQRHRAGLL
jgi:diadenylate cyclase